MLEEALGRWRQLQEHREVMTYPSGTLSLREKRYDTKFEGPQDKKLILWALTSLSVDAFQVPEEYVMTPRYSFAA